MLKSISGAKNDDDKVANLEREVQELKKDVKNLKDTFKYICRNILKTELKPLQEKRNNTNDLVGSWICLALSLTFFVIAVLFCCVVFATKQSLQKPTMDPSNHRQGNIDRNFKMFMIYF